MANKIKIRRGLKANLPTLSVGEQGLCTDTSEIFIGGSTGNIQFANKEYVDSQLAQKANKQQENWLAPTLLNGWVNFGEGENNFGVYRDNFGRVYIKGTIKSGAVSVGTVIASLPLGYRPESINIFQPPTRNSSLVWSTGNIYITPNGNINITIAQNNKLILDGISFRGA